MKERTISLRSFVLRCFRTVFSVVIVLLVIKGGCALVAEAKENASTHGVPNIATVLCQNQTEQTAEQRFAAECRRVYNDNAELLILVNKEHPLPENYSQELVYTKSGRLELGRVMYDDLVRMFDEGDQAGYGYYLSSGYRSNDKQQSLVDANVAKLMESGMSYDDALCETSRSIMPAGYSEHATGLAVDILCSDDLTMNTSQAELAGNKWLQDNCWRFGFILRYPEDKECITGIIFEPWHFRYVGAQTASFLHENELTLEEFYDCMNG